MLDDTAKTTTQDLARTAKPSRKTATELALTTPGRTKPRLGKKAGALRPRRLTVKLLDRLEPETVVYDTEAKGLRVECGRTGVKRVRYKTDLREDSAAHGPGAPRRST